MIVLGWALLSCAQGQVTVDCPASEQGDWYLDLDGDGFGTGEAERGCDPLTGYAAAPGDCDDADPSVHPQAAEDPCVSRDLDCDGLAGLRDLDQDGFTTCEDCDDSDPAVHPDAEEVCNGLDDDCDGTADVGAEDIATWYPDRDSDGWGDGTAAVQACDAPEAHVTLAGDCDDTDPAVISCGRSCLEVRDRGLGSQDGLYSLDPCGTGTPASFWCDLSHDRGGWTVAGWQAAQRTTSLGLEVRDTPGDDEWSVDLACVPFSEIGVFNRTAGEWFSDAFDDQEWTATELNVAVGEVGAAFKHGDYANSATGIVMGCVGYAYNNGVWPSYACDNDWDGGQRGHLADYAGEFCEGGRLDGTWAWTDGETCEARGQDYTWGYALR